MSQDDKEKERLPTHINRKLQTATCHLATLTRDASWQLARITKKKSSYQATLIENINLQPVTYNPVEIDI
jgi:hypothetical protein